MKPITLKIASPAYRLVALFTTTAVTASLQNIVAEKSQLFLCKEVKSEDFLTKWNAESNANCTTFCDVS